ncbi:MAG: lactoylglutathione lyase [marine bacterium B5-7]|nr:MAG: lactoylglutathione lyase [marine bacterium B5-7]
MQQIDIDSVADIQRSLVFYRDGLSFSTNTTEENPSVVFFQTQGIILELFQKDINLDAPPQDSGFGGITLAQIVRSKAEVKKVLQLAEQAGGHIVKPAQDVFWGGYHGYFAALDNDYWEIAYWENWRFNPDGSLNVANV